VKTGLTTITQTRFVWTEITLKENQSKRNYYFKYFWPLRIKMWINISFIIAAISTFLNASNIPFDDYSFENKPITNDEYIDYPEIKNEVKNDTLKLFGTVYTKTLTVKPIIDTKTLSKYLISNIFHYYPSSFLFGFEKSIIKIHF